VISCTTAGCHFIITQNCKSEISLSYILRALTFINENALCMTGAEGGGKKVAYTIFSLRRGMSKNCTPQKPFKLMYPYRH